MILSAIVLSVDAWDRWVKLCILTQQQNPQPGTEPSVRNSPGGRKSQCTPGEWISGAGNAAAWWVQAWGIQIWITQKSCSVCFSWYILLKLSKFHSIDLVRTLKYCQAFFFGHSVYMCQLLLTWSPALVWAEPVSKIFDWGLFQCEKLLIMVH